MVSPKIKTLVDILATHYTPTFQGIVFAEQRQAATCLAGVLPYIEESKGLVKCGDVCGDVSDVEELLRGTLKYSRGPDMVKLFREGTINLLIATSVAEERLGFPACDTVIRFNPLQYMVAYVQSCGRVRNNLSKFITMLPEGDIISRAKYETFSQAEVRLKDAYNVSRPQAFSEAAKDTDSDAHEKVELDMQDRERYRETFKPHGSSSQFTPPSSYEVPSKHSKEAKRAVTFEAVKKLRKLHVFDEYLLPVASENGEAAEDVHRRPLLDYEGILVTMDVWARDPWGLGDRDRLWLHPVYMNGVLVTGLATGTLLPVVQFDSGFGTFRKGSPLVFYDEEEGIQRKMLEYTRLGIRHLPDYEVIERLLSHLKGYEIGRDWSEITEADYGLQPTQADLNANVASTGQALKERSMRRTLNTTPIGVHGKVLEIVRVGRQPTDQ
ncbi:type iii restriction enzyme [Moniliophthora roreri]|nr:type iii restriction enzyme [Moniliophthora roreri]